MVDDNSAPVGGKLSPQAAGLLLDHLSAGISGQVPLEEVFRALSDDLSDRRLRFVAKRLAEQLEQGADIETATAPLSTILPTHLRRALLMGVQSGNLSSILAGLSESELARRRMHRDLRAALAYGTC